MAEYYEDTNPGYKLPTEVLLPIFSMISVRDMIKCRQVCNRWKMIIDEICSEPGKWTTFCMEDFKDCYTVARKKAYAELTDYHLYRSLTLWSSLRNAMQMSMDFCVASGVTDEVRCVEVLEKGLLAVNKKCAVQYFDADTLKPSKRGPIMGDYAKYTENDYAIVIQTYHLRLFVIWKIPYYQLNKYNVKYENIKMFILTAEDLYMVSLSDEVLVVDLTKDHTTQQFMRQPQDLDTIISIGFKDGNLYALTYKRNIYTVIDEEVELIETLDESSNIMAVLDRYNLLQLMNWRTFYQWMIVLNHSIPEGPLMDIITIRPYGDIYFVGCNYGVLRIYYQPFINGELDIFNSHPIKQLNFMDHKELPEQITCPIVNIDVLEGEDGHTLFVAMPKKVAVLTFKHALKDNMMIHVYEQIRQMRELRFY